MKTENEGMPLADATLPAGHAVPIGTGNLTGKTKQLPMTQTPELLSWWSVVTESSALKLSRLCSMGGAGPCGAAHPNHRRNSESGSSMAATSVVEQEGMPTDLLQVRR
jgi:hypothetical protein